MKVIERKARQIVRQSYIEYLETIDGKYFNTDDMDFAYRTYSSQMVMLKQLFPETTNQESLEQLWNGVYYSNKRKDGWK